MTAPNSTATTARFVLYRRVSTSEQGKSGLGLEAQLRDINVYLGGFTSDGVEVVGEFVEVHSGSDDERPELANAIALAKRVRATLLVAKLDRLSRKVSLIAALMEDRKLSFKVACMPHAEPFQLHIYAALAEQERTFISQRTKAALASAKTAGKVLGGLRDATMKRNVAVREAAVARAERVSDIVGPLRAAGKSLREVAAELNRAGVETARGGAWQASQVKRTLERLGV